MTPEPAANVYDSHDLTIHYARLFDVPLDPAPLLAGASVYHLRGQRFVQDPQHEGPWPLDLTPEERELGRKGMWERYVAPLVAEVGDCGAPGWPPATVAAYDDVTFAELLRLRGASADAVALLRLGPLDLLGEGFDATSALDVLREVAHRARMKQVYYLRGGSDRLPEAMAAHLGDRVRYGSPVVRVEHDADAVRVVCLRGGAHHTLTADYLVCTLPLPLLGRIEISPPLSPEKRQAIAEVVAQEQHHGAALALLGGVQAGHRHGVGKTLLAGQGGLPRVSQQVVQPAGGRTDFVGAREEVVSLAPALLVLGHRPQEAHVLIVAEARPATEPAIDLGLHHLVERHVTP